MKKSQIFLFAAIGVVAVIAVIALLRRDAGSGELAQEGGQNRPQNVADATPASKDEPLSSQADDATVATQSVITVNRNILGRKRPGDNVLFDDLDHPFSAEDKTLAKAVQSILDEKVDALSQNNVGTPEYEEAKAQLLDAAAKAAASANPAVRQFAVEAYSWLGGEALPEVSPMMADRDEEVAEAAIEAVEQALSEQENAQLRFEAGIAYMSTFSANEDALNMLSGISSSSALELIDPVGDSPAAIQRAAEKREMVVTLISDLIDSPSELCSAAGRELYNDVTGETWVNAEEAHLWAQDPDNYEAPDVDLD